MIKPSVEEKKYKCRENYTLLTSDKVFDGFDILHGEGCCVNNKILRYFSDDETGGSRLAELKTQYFNTARTYGLYFNMSEASDDMSYVLIRKAILNGYERSTEPSKNFVVQAWKE
jgi:hypothetical protein